MNYIEDLKTPVDIPSSTDSSIYQEIIGLGDNYGSLITKEESDIEGNKNTGEKVCNSPNTLIKPEFYEYDNRNLLSIKQEEIDIKDDFLCHSPDKPDSNCEKDTSSNSVEHSLSNYKCVKINLIYHPIMHTREKRFICAICDYKTASKSNLKVHLTKHTGEKPFSCTFCDYRCVTKGLLKQHLPKHTGEKRFSCTYCDYKCACKSHLNTHLAKHTGRKPFSCTFCDYKCVCKSLLNGHLRKHTGEKPFSCTYCDYKFARKSALKTHLANHTGEKPFSCTFCDYKCVRKCLLNQHLRNHTGEKPFSCNYCDYKSATKFSLKRHLLKHTGEKPFSCTICGNKYIQKTSLIYHMKSHDDETITFKEFVPNSAGKMLTVEGNEMPTEDKYELARTLKLDLEREQCDVQINSYQNIIIKQEEVDIKEEPL